MIFICLVISSNLQNSWTGFVGTFTGRQLVLLRLRFINYQKKKNKSHFLKYEK